MSQTKALLEAVRDKLKTDITAVGSRVYVTLGDALDLRPTSDTTLPYLVVSDGGVEYAWMPGKAANTRYQVIVTAYVQNPQHVEAPVLGDTPTGKKGVAELSSSIVLALVNNLLAAWIAGIEYALPDGETPASYLAEETWWAVTKSVRMRYEMSEQL